MDRRIWAGAGLAAAGGVLTLVVLTPAPPPATAAVSLVAAPAEAPRSAITATGPGSWTVPGQLAPGLYRTNGSTDPGQQCIWQSYGGSTVVNSGVGDPGVPQAVIIDPTDTVFQATDCGTWTKVG